MTTTAEFWGNEFGDEYHQRNRVDWRARIPFWRDVIDLTGARSVFELGCGPGWNLSAIKRAFPDVQTYGDDINDMARWQAKTAGHEICECSDADFDLAYACDLSYTCGMLIHVPPEELPDAMQLLIDASSQYVLSVEYESTEEEEVEYRGHSGKLWRRPFGKMYESMGLKLVKQWDAGPGFDRCVATLLEKA